MSLEELNQSLYKQDQGKSDPLLNEHGQRTDAFDGTRTNEGADKSPFQKEEQWGTPGMTKKQKRIIWFSVSATVLLILLITGSVFYKIWQRDAFHEDQVLFSIDGPRDVDSTQEVKYVVKIKNNNRVTLKGSDLVLTYLENFQPTQNVNLKYLSQTSSKVFIGDVKAGAEASVEVNGIFYAPKDFPVYLRGELQYTPSNGSQIVSLKTQYGVTVATSPVVLDVIAPDEVSDGDEVEYDIEYRNLDTRPLKDVQVKVNYPDGFQLKATQPQASEKGSVWYIGSIEPGYGGKIKIYGQQKGIKDDSKLLKVSLGTSGKDGSFVVFNQREKDILITEPILSIKQVAVNAENSIAKPGMNLTYKLTFKNNGTVGLRDVILTAKVQGSVLDLTKIQTSNGAYDEKTGVITWKASELPVLAKIEPGAGGEVTYSVPVKQVIPVEKEEDKNFTVSSIAKIDSPDIPSPIGSNKVISSNTLSLKVSSKVLLDVAGYYKDEKIQNSGPIPPQVGKTTTYVMHWKITNVSNDLSDVKLVSSLPNGVKWTGQAYPGEEKFSYNERTNQIVWEVGNVRAGAGIVSSKREVAFQIVIKPQPSQAGTMPVLLNRATLTGKDTFTGEDVTVTAPQKDTQLPEDATVDYAGAKVSP